MRAPVCNGDGSAVCARVGGLVLRARPKPEALSRASPCPSAWNACGFGTQAFYSASAFNANIGAWNTASVSNMASVCAACSARRRALWRDALGRASVRCGPLCAAASPLRARVCTLSGTRLRGALVVGTAARRGGFSSIHASEYVYMWVRVCVTRVYVHTLSMYLYIRESVGVMNACTSVRW
jgi:surface protein